MSISVPPCSCFAADAWADAAAKYPVGGVVRGVVGAVTPYGVFVQIAEDVDGLVHATDPGLVLLGVPDVWQYIVKGLVIIGAVLLDRFRLGQGART